MAANPRVIGKSTDLINCGPGMRFEVNEYGRMQPAFAIRYQGKVFAYLNRCAHIPVELDWQEGQFFDYSGLYIICSTHGALYEPRTGDCITGPCNGRGLVPLQVEERDEQIYIYDLVISKIERKGAL